MSQLKEQSRSSISILRHNLLIAKYIRDPVSFVQKELRENPSEDQALFLNSLSDLSNLYGIISAGRGSGKTKVLAWALAWSVACLPAVYGKYDVCVVGGSHKQAKALYEYFESYIVRTPLLKNKLVKEPLRSETIFRDSRVQCLTASERQVRSPHPEMLIFDEVCSADDNLVESALPMVGAGGHGRILLSSTPNEMFGIFRRYWEKAKEFGFTRYGPWPLTRCWWVTERQPHFIEQARKTYSVDKFKVEIMGEFAMAKGSVFDPAAISDAKVPSLEPLDDYTISMGIDWGFVHPTVITVVQTVNNGQRNVLFVEAHEQEKYSYLQDRIDQIYRQFNASVVFADSSHKGENERLRAKGINVEEVKFAGEKYTLIENMRFLLDKRLIKIPENERELLYQLGAFSYKELPSGKTSIRKVDDDYVDSIMLACKSTIRGEVQLPQLY